MRRSLWTILALTTLVAGVPRVAAADTIPIGLLAFDVDTLIGGSTAFDILNFTGQGLGAPYLDTPLTITISDLTADISGGSPLSISGSAFTADPFGNLTCSALGDAASGGCNFAAYNVLSATLTGTLSPISDIVGLPPGFSGLQRAFTAVLLPLSGPTLTGGDFVGIDATLVPATTPVPEPATGSLMVIAFAVLLAGFGADRRTRLVNRSGSPTEPIQSSARASNRELILRAAQ